MLGLRAAVQLGLQRRCVQQQCLVHMQYTHKAVPNMWLVRVAQRSLVLLQKQASRDDAIALCKAALDAIHAASVRSVQSWLGGGEVPNEVSDEA